MTIEKSAKKASPETYIGIKLPNEAGEVAVLEKRRKKKAGEFRRIPNHKALLRRGPRDDLIGGRVVNHIVSFEEKRRWTSAAGASAASSRLH